MFLYVFILIVSWVTVTDSCMAMIPPDGAYITSTEKPVTNAPGDDCKTCDIVEIEPEITPPGTVFETKELAATGACKQTSVTCRRTDGQTCEAVVIKAETDIGVVTISNLMNTDTATVTLDCLADGTYQWNGITDAITKLECAYETCTGGGEDQCTTCDINTIAPTMPVDTSFVSNELATGACKTTQVVCQRDDGQICSKVTIKGTNPSGEAILIAEDNTDQATTTLTCDENGMYSSGTTSQISKLACEFDGCVLPCSTCDINTIAPNPANLPADTTFDSMEQATGGCKQTQVTCKRTDNKACTVSITDTTATGTTNLITAVDASQASAVLVCNADAKYVGGVDPITQLGCTYDCRPPCEKCDITTIAPLINPTGTVFEFIENVQAGTCTNAGVTCRRTDGATCANMAIMATHPGGTAQVNSATDVDLLSAILFCEGDGTWGDSIEKGFTRLECVYTNCPLPCEKCVIASIAPPMPGGTTFESTELATAGNCKQTSVTCRRTDNLVCGTVIMRGIGPTGNVQIAVTNAGNSVSETLECKGDGFYAFGTTTILQLECTFDNCVPPPPPCATCDISTVAITAANPDIQIQITEEGFNGSGCKRTRVTFIKPTATDCPTGKDIIAALPVTFHPSHVDRSVAMAKNNSTKPIRVEATECVKCLSVDGHCVKAAQKLYCYVKTELNVFYEKLDEYCINSTKADTTTTPITEPSFATNTTVIARDTYKESSQVISMLIGCVIMICLHTALKTAKTPLFQRGLRELWKISREICHQIHQFSTFMISWIRGKISGGGVGPATPSDASHATQFDNNDNHWIENGGGADSGTPETSSVVANAPREEEEEPIDENFRKEEEEEAGDDMSHVAEWLAA